jgi:16S rRNA (guanine(966)-N(2))-methyltransferase RsmD
MRIIGGMYKGRELLPPPGAQTRPITGSVKKSLFGMLGEDLAGQVVIDLFCGTGTLGIEALSRSASKCYFGELNDRVVQRLRQNLAAVGAAGRAVVWRGDVMRQLPTWLNDVAELADLVFLDPPYELARTWDWQAVVAGVLAPLAGRLAPDGVVVLRMDDLAAPPLDFGPLSLARVRQYGNMVLMLLTPAQPAP